MKRYSVHIHSLACIAEEDGEFVKATDAAAIEQERDRLRAQRDHLAALVKKHCQTKCGHCDGMGIDMREDEDRECQKCKGSGSAYPDEVAGILGEIEKEVEK